MPNFRVLATDRTSEMLGLFPQTIAQDLTYFSNCDRGTNPDRVSEGRVLSRRKSSDEVMKTESRNPPVGTSSGNSVEMMAHIRTYVIVRYHRTSGNGSASFPPARTPLTIDSIGLQ